MVCSDTAIGTAGIEILALTGILFHFLNEMPEVNLKDRKDSMLDVVASWGVVAVIGPLLIGIGFGVLSMTPPEVEVSICCFVAGLLVILVKTAWWVTFQRAESVLRRAAFLTFALLGIGAFGFFSVTFALQKNNRGSPSLATTLPREPALSAAPYSVIADVTLFSPTRQGAVMFWLVFEAPPSCTVSPTNMAVHFSITNLQAHPTTMLGIKVEVMAGDGSWVQLYRLNTMGAYVFFGPINMAAPLTDTKEGSVLLDRILFESAVSPHQPAHGWLFFEYPREYGLSFGPSLMPRFRVTIGDDLGTEYVSPVLESNPNSASVQGAYIPYGSGRSDLRKCKASYVSDRSPFVIPAPSRTGAPASGNATGSGPQSAAR